MLKKHPYTLVLCLGREICAGYFGRLFCFLLLFVFYSSLFPGENQFCVCKVTKSEDMTEGSCPHLENNS